MSYNDLLAAKRRELINEARSIIDTAGAEKRDRLNPNEQARFDALTSALEAQGEMRTQLDKKERSIVASEEAMRRLADTPISHHAPQKVDPVVDEFRSAVLERNPKTIVVGGEDQRSYYQPGVEARALSTTSPANMRPVGLYGKIVQTLVETSAVTRAGATMVVTNNGEDLRIPRATAMSTAGIVTEAAVLPESDPTLGSVTFGAFKFGFLVTLSNEMIEDDTLNIEGYIAEQAGIAIGNGLGTKLINGAGTTEPTGVITAATLGITGPTGTSTTLGAQGTAGQGTDLLNGLWGSLAEPYTRSAAAGFLLRTASLTGVRNLKGTTGDLVGNQYLAQAPAPFYVDPFVPAMAANAKSILFGDWSRYFVRMVNSMRFEQSRDFAFNTDQTVFRVVVRADGNLMDPSAIKWFANSAT